MKKSPMLLVKAACSSALIVSCTFAVLGAQSRNNSASLRAYVAHDLRRMPTGARGASVHTTKGGVRYVRYSPIDEFGTLASEQQYFWWVSEPWDGNDQPYAAVRKATDAAIKTGAKPLTLSARYRALLNNNPWDSVAVYRWAYATWLARKRIKDGSASRKLFVPVSEYMPKVRFPGSYQFARMAFLTQAYARPRLALKLVGDKLLRRNPKDEDVKFYMIRVLTAGKETGTAAGRVFDSRDDQRALAYIAFFRNKYPKDEGYDWLYADRLWYFYSRQYPLESSKAQAATAAFRNFLRKHPNTAYRKAALDYIADIKRQQNNWELWGRENWLKAQSKQRAQ